MAARWSPFGSIQEIFRDNVQMMHVFSNLVLPSFLWSSAWHLAFNLETQGSPPYRIFATVHNMSVPLELSFHHLGRDWCNTSFGMTNLVTGRLCCCHGSFCCGFEGFIVGNRHRCRTETTPWLRKLVSPLHPRWLMLAGPCPHPWSPGGPIAGLCTRTGKHSAYQRFSLVTSNWRSMKSRQCWRLTSSDGIIFAFATSFKSYQQISM